MSQCAYVHDVGGATFDDLDGTEWPCPHPTVDSSDYCVFHILRYDEPPPLDAAGYGNALTTAVESEDRSRNRILGAVLPAVDLQYRILDGGTNHPIDLRDATVRGPVRAADAELRQELRCDGAQFEGPVLAEGIVFHDDAAFTGARFEQRVVFTSATFDAWAGFDECIFRGMFNIRLARLRKGISAMDARFEGGLDAMSAQFGQVANFSGATFETGALFASTVFEGDLTLDATTLGESVATGGDRRENPTLSEGRFDYNRPEIPDMSVIVRDCQCHGAIDMHGTDVGADIHLGENRIEGDVDLSELDTGSTVAVDFSGTDVVSGTLPIRPGFRYDFADATIGDASFREAGGTFSADQLNLRNTEFQGFDFGRHKEALRQVDWNICGDSEANPAVKENTYLRAKNGAAAMGDTPAASEFHMRELDNRGRSYGRKLRSAGDLRKRVRFLLKWVSNRFLKYTCGYGERPSYVVLSSIGVIGFYALLYTLVSVPSSYQGAAGRVVLSFDAFNALALGFPTVDRLITGVLVTSEAFLGPFFIALFVFTITQSINR